MQDPVPRPPSNRSRQSAPVVGLIVFALSAGAFVYLGCSFSDDELNRLDDALANSLHQHAVESPLLVNVFNFITDLASRWVLIGYASLVALAFIVTGLRRLLLGWIPVLTGGYFLTRSLKDLFSFRERPTFSDPLIMESSSSFPSGHATASLIFYGFLAYLLIQSRPCSKRRLLAACALALLILAIGFSRLYLGAHYFTDVVGGYAAGLAWLTFCVSGWKLLRWHREAKRPLTRK